jgi:hypothetical protein
MLSLSVPTKDCVIALLEYALVLMAMRGRLANEVSYLFPHSTFALDDWLVNILFALLISIEQLFESCRLL